jgi:N-methylhydantoinase A
MTYLIGVDSGGTFTDTVIVAPDGRVAVGKALSTPDRPATGVLDSIAVAAAELGIDQGEALAECTMLAHGTTVGLNALLTRNGARIGLLTTSGFEDIVPMARMNKAVGLDAEHFTDQAAWAKPEPLMPRSCIVGVTERIDRNGDVVLPLDEDSVRTAIETLGAQGVQAIAVSYLWSFLRPEHEQRTRELIEEILPGVHITLSSDLVPKIGEYERTMSVLLNCYVAPKVHDYLSDLGKQLADGGFHGSFLVTKSSGGVQTAATITSRSLDTLKSGPVGGLSATASIGARLGHTHVIASDVGGTSFDVGLIVDGRPQYAAKAMLGRYEIALPMIDIESIGTGGGSIAWLDPDSGALRVGPQSAGAKPGPACYRRGGQLPTVTDAAVVLGYLDRLGGALELDRTAAREAVEKVIAAPLGLPVEQAAEGILAVSNAQMADLVRRVTVLRGYDPREFALYAFGGAAPQYAGRYAADLGVRELVIPAFAPVFSAYGAVTSDLRTSADFEAPCAFPPAVAWLSDILRSLEEKARTELEGGGDDPRVERWLALRFRRQVHQLSVALPDGEIDEAALAAVARAFHEEYERSFGVGTAYADAGVELAGIRVEVISPTTVPSPARVGATSTEAVSERLAWFDGAEVACPVYDANTTAAGFPIHGPAFIEQTTTALVVYPGQTAVLDDMGNTRLELHPR